MGQNWHWLAFGKHPSAKDYFRVGSSHELLQSFVDWVEGGYGSLEMGRSRGQSRCAWRFWARGPGKDSLVCGMVSDSCDSIGRPYPFVIVGVGGHDAWAAYWDLVPFACEKTWGQMEYLSAKRYPEFMQIVTDVRNLRLPETDWEAMRTIRDQVFDGCGGKPAVRQSLDRIRDEISCFSGKPEGMLCFEQQLFSDLSAPVGLFHQSLRYLEQSAPHSVFMGGTLEKACVSFFRRPLQLSDFQKLWSLKNPEVKTHGPVAAR